MCGDRRPASGDRQSVICECSMFVHCVQCNILNVFIVLTFGRPCSLDLPSAGLLLTNRCHTQCGLFICVCIVNIRLSGCSLFLDFWIIFRCVAVCVCAYEHNPQSTVFHGCINHCNIFLSTELISMQLAYAVLLPDTIASYVPY